MQPRRQVYRVPAAAVNVVSQLSHARIENPRRFVPKTENATVWEREKMARRPVATGTEARAGTKEGVVRYILMASLVLVVLLFIVAYELFS